MPERRPCERCNGTGRVSPRIAFAGICTACIRGTVVPESGGLGSQEPCPQPCEHLSQHDARERRTCAEHPCTCPDVREPEPVHWVGDAPTSLHGDGAASFELTTRKPAEVTCLLCLSLLERESVDSDPCEHHSESGDEGPVRDLGRWPTRWRCDGCDRVRHEDPCLCDECNSGDLR